MSHPACIQHLRDYVAIPSVNPMGRGDIPATIAGERRYAEHLREQLRGIGVDAELVGEGERSSVVACVTTPGASETFMVASHLDTVPVDSMEIDPFDPTIADGRLYGRGSCDTKGGMAALMEALERVLSRGRLGRNLILVGESDEEFTSVGVQDVLSHLGGGATRSDDGPANRPADRPADWVLATEPTELRLVTHHKGIALARLAATGRACHASNPALGRNAIVELSRAVLSLDDLSKEIGSRSQAPLGSPTLSIGVIHGGQSPNIVPDSAWLSIDRRMLPGEDAEQVRQELESAIARSGATDVRVEQCGEAKPPLGTPEDSPSVHACQAALASHGLSGEPGSVAFGTDAGVFARHGLPGIVMGPGSIEQAHTDREFVDVREVSTMVDIFTSLLQGDAPPARGAR